MLIQRNTKKKNTKSFIEDCITKRGDKYDYSLVSYINSKTKVDIICNKHGVFKQTPNNHLRVQDCPECSGKYFNKKGNREIINDFILLNGDKYDYSKECFYKKELRFDFYLPKLNICIEYDGEQHFRPVEFYGGEEKFKIQKSRDLIKSNYCNLNNIKLIRISYKDDIKNKIKDNVYY